MKGQNFASQVLSRHTFRMSRKKGSDFFDHRGTLMNENVKKKLHTFNIAVSVSKNASILAPEFVLI